MKAFLLAAGEGTRLRPLTAQRPKCMVEINQTPLLGIWLTHLCRYGVTEVLVNLHPFPEQVIHYVENHDFGLRVETIFEPQLLGTAGTIVRNKTFVADESEFLIAYADNLTNVDLGTFFQFHRDKKSPFSMGLSYTDKPREKGIVILDQEGRITEFVEKPVEPPSNIASAGLYISSQKIFEYLPNELTTETIIDFGFDILPKLIGRMYGYLIPEYLIDIGTFESYTKAQQDWPGVLQKK